MAALLELFELRYTNYNLIFCDWQKKSAWWLKKQLKTIVGVAVEQEFLRIRDKEKKKYWRLKKHQERPVRRQQLIGVAFM